MPDLSLTDFVDIVSKSGTPKATKVRQVKNRPPYSPALDFYRPLRTAIVEAHRDGFGKAHVSDVLQTLADRKKRKNYPDVVKAYKSWWGRKTFQWFDPPQDLWTYRRFDVRVNPELGLIHDGQHHLVKLYFKSDPLGKSRVEVILFLMEAVLSGSAPPGTVMSILDIRRKKWIKPTVQVPGLDALLRAEIAWLATIWPTV